MSKDGFRIFDTDTHVGPSMDVLEGYMSEAERQKLEPFAQYRSVAKRTGQVTYRMGARKYERQLGRADSGVDRSNGGGYMAGFTGAHKGREPVPTVDHDVHSRITDMDFEGVDVNLLLPSGWFGAWTTVDDVGLEAAAFRAYNRWMNDYLLDQCFSMPLASNPPIIAASNKVHNVGWNAHDQLQHDELWLG